MNDLDSLLPDGDLSWIDSQDFITTQNLPTPIRYDRKRAKAEYINGLKKQVLSDLLKELPPPDTDVYILSNGSGGTYHIGDANPKAFEFGHFIPVLCELLGNKGVTAYISTWTMNRWHALNMLQMLDDGILSSLSVLTDPYFLQRESVVANTLVEGLMKRHQRFKAFKNHVKAVCLSDGSQVVSILASANLSAQPRAENFTLSTDSGLHTFLVSQFFEVMLNVESD